MTVDNSKMKKESYIPIKVRKQIRNDKIKTLYRKGFSMDEICMTEGVSKTTVFFAINGRSKKKLTKISKINNKNNN